MLSWSQVLLLGKSTNHPNFQMSHHFSIRRSRESYPLSMLVTGKSQDPSLSRGRHLWAGREFSSTGVITVSFQEPTGEMGLGHLEKKIGSFLNENSSMLCFFLRQI